MSTWDMRRTIGAIGVAVAVAGVGGAAIAAATDGGRSMMDGGWRGPGGPPWGQARDRPGDGPLGSVHAEYVVADDHGGFSTHASQNGRITSISATSVAVRSDDGFAATYVIPASVPAHFAVGDEVAVEATRNGTAAVVDAMRPPPPPATSR